MVAVGTVNPLSLRLGRFDSYTAHQHLARYLVMRDEVYKSQLGMSLGTAQNRLVKDLLFDFICKTNQNKCFQCGKEMSREDFSVEHKTPWRHKENAKELFFSLDNISYSHLRCNMKAARPAQIGDRKPKPIKHGTVSGYRRGCRCEPCRLSKNAEGRKYYNSARRKEKYLRNGT
ncbi:HNH endonuclease [Salmonella phage SeKF_63]